MSTVSSRSGMSESKPCHDVVFDFAFVLRVTQSD